MSIDKTRRGFEESFREAVFYNKQFYTFEEFDGMLKEAGLDFVSSHDSVIRFPRKNPEEYEDLLRQYDKRILDGYGIEITGDEIWIMENVLNMVYQKK